MILKKWFVYAASLVAISSVFTEAQDETTWIKSLPDDIQSKIIWSTDYEKKSLGDWRMDFLELDGGFVSRTNGGSARAIRETKVDNRDAHSGEYVAQCKISNAGCPSSKNRGGQMVRYAMGNRIPNFKTGKGYLPEKAYFSTWMLFDDLPAASECESKRQSLKIFDFKSDPNPGNRNFDSETESMFSITVDHNKLGKPYFTMYSQYNDGHYDQIQFTNRKKIPVNRWIHLEAFYSVNNRNGGQIIVWQNGEKILEASEVRTGLTDNGMVQFPIWALGPYTDEGGPWDDVSILFDDSIISIERVSGYIPWVQYLPSTVQDAIIWSADHELGNMEEWYPPNEDPNTGGIYMSRGTKEWQEDAEDPTGNNDKMVYAQATDSAVSPHTGRYAAEATISEATNGSQEGVRLMRSMIPPKNLGWFYSTWMYFADTYDPSLFFNVFQFKSDPDTTNQDASDSVSKYSLNVEFDKAENKMNFYLNYKECGADEDDIKKQRSIDQKESRKRYIPQREWIHVEAYYKLDNGEGAGNPRGEIIVWQNGDRILEEKNVVTSCTPGYMKKQYPIWGVGVYSDGISGGTKNGQATIYFDDAVISKVKMHDYIDDV